MTKADLVERVHQKIGFPKKSSAEIVELVFETIKETLELGERIKISGFGNFDVRPKKQRTGRNPQTGEEIQISARRVLTFKASQVLKNALNNHAGGAVDADFEDEDDDEDDEDEDEDTLQDAGRL
jgi:integration host factor subunit alpha